MASAGFKSAIPAIKWLQTYTLDWDHSVSNRLKIIYGNNKYMSMKYHRGFKLNK
jgi:hypothetical protein